MVMVMGGEKGREPREFETFGPKALAGTESVPEDLRDRLIVLRTIRAPSKFPPVRPDDSVFTKLRSMSYRWAMRNGWKLDAVSDMLVEAKPGTLAGEEWKTLSQYHGRPHDLWLPIEVLMEALQVPLSDRDAAREYYAQSQAVTEAAPPQDRLELVQALWELSKGRGSGEVFTVTRSELQDLLNDNDEESPRRWTPGKIGKQIGALVGVMKAKARAYDRADMVYDIDRSKLATWAMNYGLTDSTESDRKEESEPVGVKT
jgi:hypothetical protein